MAERTRLFEQGAHRIRVGHDAADPSRGRRANHDEHGYREQMQIDTVFRRRIIRTDITRVSGRERKIQRPVEHAAGLRRWRVA